MKTSKYIACIDYKASYKPLLLEYKVLNNAKSEAYWTDGEDVLLFAIKTYAEDLARGLCLNGYPAMVVTVPNFIEDLKNPDAGID